MAGRGKGSSGKSSGKGKSSGGHYRSAISGRFVTTKHGKANPRTTVKEGK